MPPLSLRAATASDRDPILTWSNDPLTRSMSFSPAPITPAAHAAWFTARLSDPNARLFIVEQTHEPVGLVRFTLSPDGRWELGVNLAPKVRGQGLGAQVISLGVCALRAELGSVAVWARSRPENVAFARAAARAGFVERGPTLARKKGHQAVVDLPLSAGAGEEP